jgi:hypothetical protein
MAKKPVYTAFTHYMGLRQTYSPAVEEKIKHNARQHRSPLGGIARVVPLTTAFRRRGPSHEVDR